MSKTLNEFVRVLDKYYGVSLEISELFDKNFKQIKTIKNYYEKKLNQKLVIIDGLI